jgi:phosphohistidine phosphatase
VPAACCRSSAPTQSPETCQGHGGLSPRGRPDRLGGVTTRRLLLIRHGQTEQGSPDEARQLTDRGRRDSSAIGEWLRERRVVPDLVVTSPAIRARQTWELTGIDAKSEVDERLYVNTESDLLAIMRSADESVATLAIVGHNPSIESFAARYGGPGEISTGSVVVFAVDGTWADGDVRYVEVTTCRG